MITVQTFTSEDLNKLYLYSCMQYTCVFKHHFLWTDIIIDTKTSILNMNTKAAGFGSFRYKSHDVSLHSLIYITKETDILPSMLSM